MNAIDVVMWPIQKIIGVRNMPYIFLGLSILMVILILIRFLSLVEAHFIAFIFKNIYNLIN